MYNKLMGVICDENGKFIKNADEIKEIVSNLIKDIDRLKANYKEINELVENKGADEIFETYFKYGIDVLETLSKYKEYYDQIQEIIRNVSDITAVLKFINIYEVDGINLLSNSNDKAIEEIINIQKNLNSYINKLNGEPIPSMTWIAVDRQSGIVGYGNSGNYIHNSSVSENIDNLSSSNEYVYEYTKILGIDIDENKNLSKNNYIDNMNINNETKVELEKLRDCILNTCEEAQKITNANPNDPSKAKIDQNTGLPSFQKNWFVTNCAEIWAARNAILNGAKFDNLVFRSQRTIKNNPFQAPCNNCKRTFKNNYVIDDNKIYTP